MEGPAEVSMEGLVLATCQHTPLRLIPASELARAGLEGTGEPAAI
jgi:hypothetical protein